MTTDIDVMQQDVYQWLRDNFPKTTSTEELLGIVEEVGELSHAHLKTIEKIRGPEEKHFEEKVDAVGDIVIYLMNYCSLEGINFHDAVVNTWAKVGKRDWVGYPDGPHCATCGRQTEWPVRVCDQCIKEERTPVAHA